MREDLSSNPYDGFEGVNEKLRNGEFRKLKKNEYEDSISEEALNSIPNRDEISLE